MEETKKKLSGGKIAAIVIAAVLGVILIAVGVLAIVLFGAKQPEAVKVDYQELNVSMLDPADPTGATMKYYIGKTDAGKVSLTTAFPGGTNFAGTGIDASAGKFKRTQNNDFVLTYNNADGATVTVNVYVVDGKNVTGARTEKNMRDELKKGNSVVLHDNLVTKDKDGFGIKDGATVYGNGKELHADSISAPKGEKSWGSTLFYTSNNTSLNVQDLHIFVNTIVANEEGKMEVDLDKFQYSGTGFDVNSYSKDGVYPKSSLKNSIVENGQKLVHVTGGDVLIEGCIIRNGADANIAAGTYNHQGSKITVRNSVSMNSMVAGFLFYGWDPANSENNQTVLNVEGFFDIYNWKNTTAAKLVPATEAPLDTIVNGQVLKEINNPTFAPFVYLYDANKDGKIQMPAAAAANYPDRADEIEVSNSVDERYIHIGIIRLATGSLTKQNPHIQFNGEEPGTDSDKGFHEAGLQESYAEIDFPLPEWVKKPPLDIVKRCDMISFDSTKVPTIAPDQQLDTKTIYKDMIFGRATAPVPAK